MDNKKLPVVAIGIFVIVMGVLSIFSEFYNTHDSSGKIFNTIYTLLLLVYVISGFYLIKLYNWARLAIIFSAVASCLVCGSTAVIFLNGPHSGLNSASRMLNEPVSSIVAKFIAMDVFLGIVVQFLILFYLTRPQVIASFKRQRFDFGFLIVSGIFLFGVLVFIGQLLYVVLIKAPSMEMPVPVALKNPSVLQGEGTLKKVKWIDVPGVGFVSDILIGNIPKTLNAEFGVAGSAGAAFLSSDLKVKSQVSFLPSRIASPVNIIDMDNDGSVEFLKRGSWSENPAILNQNGSLRWEYGKGGPGVDDMAFGHFDHGQLGFVAGFNGDGGLHFLDKNGKEIWKVKGGNIWHVETIVSANGTSEILHSSACGELTIRNSKGQILKIIKSKLCVSEFSLLKPDSRYILVAGKRHIQLLDFEGKVVKDFNAPDVDETGFPRGTIVRFDLNGPQYYAFNVSYSIWERCNFYLFSEDGKLQYHEILAEQCPAITTKPVLPGREALLLGGDSRIWQYSK